MAEDSEHDNKWSDGLCGRIALEDNFPSAVYDRALQKKIIDRFLNFYLGGRPRTGMSVYDLIYSTISIMPLDKETEDFIWKPVHYRENGTLFFLSPDEKLNADYQLVLEKNAANEKVAQDSHEVIEVSDHEEDCNFRSRESQTESENENQQGTGTASKGEEAMIAQRLDDKNDDSTDPQNLESHKTNESEDVRRRTTSCDSLEKEDTITDKEPPSQKIRDDFIQETPEENEQYASSFTKDFIPKFPENLTLYHRNNYSSQEAKYKTFGPTENCAFIISCNSLLKHWDTSTEARIFLKYFFGMIALTLMRATTKSYKHLVNTFSSEKYIDLLPKTALVPFKYVMPHKLCLKMSYRAFYKRGINIRIMFAKLVMNSIFYISSMETKFNPFMTTVLAHTSQYGMGLLSLVHHTKRYIDNLNHVIEVTYCEDTAESWHRMVRFTECYLSTNPSQTVWWARLIDADVFAELACPRNYPLAVILASFIESWSNNSNIWRSKWVSGPKGEREKDLEKYKKLATEMFGNIQKFDVSSLFSNYESIVKKLETWGVIF